MKSKKLYKNIITGEERLFMPQVVKAMPTINSRDGKTKSYKNQGWFEVKESKPTKEATEATKAAESQKDSQGQGNRNNRNNRKTR